MNPRIFTVEEANSLVPRLARLVGGLIERAADIRGRIESLDSMRCRDRATPRPRGTVGLNLDPAVDDDDRVRAHKIDLLASIEEYEQGWREVQELGAVVKDPHTGLCDFYGRIDGRLVCLCWRYGEHAIDHYHEVDAGFSSRKPLGASLRQRMLN